MMVQSRGFVGRRGSPKIVLPGQYLTEESVLSAGPTPHVPLEQWSSRSMTAGMCCGDGAGRFRERRPNPSPQISIV